MKMSQHTLSNPETPAQGQEWAGLWLLALMGKVSFLVSEFSLLTLLSVMLKRNSESDYSVRGTKTFQV